MVVVLMEVAPGQQPGDRGRIVAAVRRALEPLREDGLTVHLVGSTVLSDALDQASRREALRTFPVALLCSLVVLALLLRTLRGMAVAASCAAVSVVLTLGLMAAVGRPLTMVSAALPSLLWVLSLANCIHVLQCYQRQLRSQPPGSAIDVAVAEATRPCTLAAITTALGFSSLLAAEMRPVRELGGFAAMGILISLPVNLFLGPELIRLLKVPAVLTLGFGDGRRLGRLATRRPVSVLVAVIAGLILAAVAIPRIRVESNPLSFLPAGHETTRAYRMVGERLTGFYSMEVVVSMPGSWTDPEMWGPLDGLSGTIGRSPSVARVLSPLDLLRKLRHWEAGFDPEDYRLPESASEAESLVVGLDERGVGLVERLVARDGRTVRLSAIVDEMDEAGFLELVRDTGAAVTELPDGFGGFVTGMVLRLVNAQQRLVAGQLKSLGLAFGVIFLAIGLGLRSWRLTAVSVLPNVLPVLATFAVMSLLDMPLDAATIMVASVALGIAVDNTVHLLTGYDRARRRGETSLAAVDETLDRVGSALVVTSLTACVGFGSLWVSAFIPIRHFGLLAAISLIVALIADLLVVPAMMVVRESR